MFSLKQAKAQAANLPGDWLVFKTPEDALCNQPGFNTFNKGRYAVCRADERADYEAGGAVFV